MLSQKICILVLMNKIHSTILILLTLIGGACNQSDNQNVPELKNEDKHSYAQPERAVVKHLFWDAVIHFDERYIDATANWKVDVQPNVTEIVFDSHRLSIIGVSVNGKEETWTIGATDPVLGTEVIIPIEASEFQRELDIALTYRTPNSAKALFWAESGQTHDKKHSFLFTQSQAILARSWIPCQDSPGIRFTYDARVRVPQGYMALMSAENPQSKNNEGVYEFSMTQPIPAYLMALAVGDIEFKALGPRTGVYAEPGQLAEAHEEFSELETMMNSAENLYGSYSWGRYDVLVLPPSFPFGGMENPRLTFATPTIIAGDKSLVSLIAHELAHSWSGNLVTNATWDDFWLNEGFTVYFENRIMEAYKGKPYANMLAVLGYRELLETIEQMGSTSADTKLKLDLKGRDPDDGMTDIAYEKGFAFLRTIEQEWGRANFDRFLNNYFQSNKFQSVNTELFLSKLEEAMGPDTYAKINAKAWVYEPGIPSNYQAPSSTRFAKVDSLYAKAGPLNISKEISADWTTHEWISFIQKLPNGDSKDLLEKLDQKYAFSQSGNSEILCVWFEKCIKNDYQKVDEDIRGFLVKVGRRKFLVPLYEGLVKQDRMDFARDIYKEAKPGYHAVSAQTIDKILSFNI